MAPGSIARDVDGTRAQRRGSSLLMERAVSVDSERRDAVPIAAWLHAGTVRLKAISSSPTPA
jgi:hypothetical protein